jgi:RNA polymerase sigma factor (sigma-70 family)
VSLDAPAPGEEESRLEQLEAPARPEGIEEALDPELESILAALPESQALVLRLTVVEGWSLRLTGKHLGVSPMTVRRAQLRGLEGLRLGTECPAIPGDKFSRSYLPLSAAF